MPKVILVYINYRQVKDTVLKPGALLARVGPAHRQRIIGSNRD